LEKNWLSQFDIVERMRILAV